MSQECKGMPPGGHDSAWPLYGAAFMMAICLSMAWTAMPFILRRIHGSEADIGNAQAFNQFAYMIALLLTGSRLGHVPVKRATLSAGTVALLATATMGAAVLLARFQDSQDTRAWIWMLVISGGVGGATMALYWPLLMSWVSSDYEGVRLNRRFGWYNGAWSGGGTIGPLIGTWLFEINLALPLLGAAGAVALSLLLLSFGRHGSTFKTPATPQPAGVPETPKNLYLLADCRWMSRISLFCACACFVVIRSQFGLVFTGESLGHTESQFGMYLTIYALCNCLALMAAGRWAWWHFRPSLLIVGQLMLLLTLFATIYGRSLPVLYASSIILGVAYGFAYCSHLYYGASASKKRSARMAIHETVISLGLTVGSAAGGYLCEHVSLYAPYWFAMIVIGAGMIGQATIHLGARARADIPGRAFVKSDVEIAEP